MADLPVIIGSFLPTWLFFKLFMFLSKKWIVGEKQILVAAALSLVLCVVMAGFTMSRTGSFDPVYSFAMYMPGQVFWLLFYIIKFKKNKQVSS